MYTLNLLTSKFCIVFVNYVHSTDVCVHSFICHLFWITFFPSNSFISYVGMKTTTTTTEKKFNVTFFISEGLNLSKDGLKSDFGCWAKSKWDWMRLTNVLEANREKIHSHKAGIKRIAMRFFFLLYCTACMRMLHCCCCYCCCHCLVSCFFFFPTFNF